MLKPLFMRFTLGVGLVTAATFLFQGCVDKDYDLAKDIDMNVTLGGEELTLPASSTDAYTMKQILDLDANSSIKPVETEGEYNLHKGDYVLLQSGDPTRSEFSINTVDISDVEGSTTNTTLDPFVVVPGQPQAVVSTGDIIVGTDMRDDDVTTELRSLSYAWTDCELNLTVYYESSDFSDEAIIKRGYTARFDKAWVVEIADAATASFAEMVDSRTLRFTADKTFSSAAAPLVLKLRVKAFDLSDMPDGQGLWKPGHFNLESDIVSGGEVAIESELLAGGTAHLDLVTVSSIPYTRLLAVRGIVDPEINVEASSFNIDDIPDFLSEPGNNLDVDNPMLYLKVTNTSGVTVDINATLVVWSRPSEGRPAEKLDEIGIGELNGTAPIVVAPNATTDICLSRTGHGYGDGVVNIKVDNLSDLFNTVPGKIEVTAIEARASQTVEAEIALNDSEHPNVYNFDAEYEAVVPLAFGRDLKLTYDTEDNDWDEDLEKYNFDRVNITFKVSNTIPMVMEPHIYAIDRNGDVIPTVTATIEGVVKAGSIQTPSETEMKAVLRSTAGNLKDLDGIRIVFDATADETCAGTPLNEAQALRFTEIRITITGGVTVDLN